MKRLFLFIFAAVACSLLNAATPLYIFSWNGVNSDDVVANTIYTDSYGVTSVLVKRSGLSKSSEIMSTKVRTIEMDLTKIVATHSTGQSIGSLVCFLKNGSTSQPCTINVYYSNGNDWVETDVFVVKPQDSLHYAPKNIVTKSKVNKVKFEFSVDTYLYELALYENENVDGAPIFVSSDPKAQERIPSAGEINLSFDEYISLNTAASSGITFGNASIIESTVYGNMLKVSYSGFDETSTLIVPSDVIRDFDGNACGTSINLQFNNDSQGPSMVSVTPAQGTTIHVQDLGEEHRMIRLKFNEKIALSLDAQIGNQSIEVSCDGKSMGDVFPVVEDSVLVLSYSGLDYAKPCTFTIPAGFVEDISGNSWAGAQLSYVTCERDHAAPQIVGQSIANGDTEKNISGSLQITFNEDVKIVSQGATVNGKPAVLTTNGNVVGLNYSNLDYSSEQTISLASGCIADTCGNAYEHPINISFTTKDIEMEELTFIVGKDDGNGCDDSYSTIQEAIDAIIDDSQRSIIYVRPGVYNEKLVVDKRNVSIIGQHRDSVIIVYDECASTSTHNPNNQTGLTTNDLGSTVASYTMLLAADNFYGEGFTVRNSYDWINGTDSKKQNVALSRTAGDSIVLNNVALEGVENVYYSKKSTGRVYMKNCRFLGGLDIITSGGTVVADSCLFNVIEGGSCLTAAFPSEYDFGIVLLNSNVMLADTTGFYPDVENTYLVGHPKKDDVKISMKDCFFESGILNALAWSKDMGNGVAEKVDFNECGTKFMSQEEALAGSQRPEYVKILAASQAENVNADRAMNLGAKGGVWNPYMYSQRPDSVIVTFDVNVEDGYCYMTWPRNSHDVGYIIYKNGNYLANLTSNELMDYLYSGNDIYEVAAYNEYGAMSPTSLNYHVSDEVDGPVFPMTQPNIGVNEAVVEGSLLAFNVVSGNLKFKRDDISKVEVYSLNAERVVSAAVAGSDSVGISVLAPGTYVARALSNDGIVYVEKFIVK
ncbi:MAG: Ig-like domain-containing protein [Paludibacteraceae bacterium]|nr:Ig-like domain-containing protein [Paludibacteraceae bacterium]